jgi:prolyl-tRNA editing enzyme YbaK/EbsC (Cys-tRNA(Pro) deacylase)
VKVVTVTDLKHELDRARLQYDVIDHPYTDTARDEARAIGVPADDVAKTIVLVTGNGYARAVLTASDQLDLHKARRLVGDKSARLASEAELVMAYPMYELGAVPPFGVPTGDRLLLDRRLALRDTAVVEAGVHDQSFRIKTRDLLALTHAEVVDIAKESGFSGNGR